MSQLAQECDSEALDLAMKSKEAQYAVQDARRVLERAEGDASAATHLESQRIARLVKEARITSYVKKISGLPRELALKILRATVASQRLKWRPTDSDSLETVIGEFYAWPSKVDRTQREVLQRDTEPLLLETAIIEIPAHFISRNNSMVPAIPKALEQNVQHVRHLVLDLRLDDRNDATQRELNRTRSGMDALRVLFPRLKVCVVSFLSQIRASVSFAASNLSLRNRTSFSQTETLETSLVNFINVFHQRGPGDRKLVRFLDQNNYSYSHAGPLVDVTSTAARIQAEETLRGEDTPSETGVSDIGKQVLTQAYRYHRSAAYRSEMV
jgi:hypothetical protein